MQRISRFLQGDGLAARAKRGTILTFLNYGGSNILRLASNLILTRILFPEAFGLMALVYVFLTGLQMFSDVGLNTSVIRSKRGEDPAFLDTAWTVQIIRGVFLWLICFPLAIPAANFYEEEMLRQLLPAVGLTALIQGFASINVLTVNRQLLLGRLTALELGSQLFAIIVMIIAALIFQSVWALVIGGIIDALAKAVLSHIVLPGKRARIHFEKTAFSELFGLGKWLFISTAANFLIRRGDLAILGKYVSLTDLAFYNIALTIALVPAILNMALIQRVYFPLLCSRPPAEDPQNRKQIFKARALVTGAMGLLCAPLILFGQDLIEVLYDPRYHMAGVILVGLAVQQFFIIITAGHEHALLAAGNGRTYAGLMIFDALVRVGMMLLGAIYFGMPGVIFGMIVGQLLVYPVLLAAVWQYRAWDWRHDAGFALMAVGLAGLAELIHPGVWGAFLALSP